MNRFRHLSVLLVLLIVVIAPCQAKEALVLLPVQGKGLNDQEKDVLRAALQEGLSRRYEVYSGAEVDKKLKKFAKISCDEKQCLQEIAIAFQGEMVGRGIVLPASGGYMLTIEIKNVFEDKVIESKTETCRNCDFLSVGDLFKQMTRVQNVNTISAANLAGGVVDVVTTVVDGVASSGDFAMLVLESEPSGADVYINSKKVGQTPYQNFDVVAGKEIKLRLSKTGYASKEFTLIVKPGANELLELRLEKALVTVTVSTQPYERGAKIYLEGSQKMLGRVPTQLQLPQGDYVFRAETNELEGRMYAHLTTGQSTNITIALKKKSYSSADTFFDPLESGGVGPLMVVIPSGVFRMGDLRGLGNADEKPVHTVTISRPFAMGRYEVTFNEYDRFARLTGRGMPDDHGWGRGERPVIEVDWYVAKAYVEWLSEQTGEKYRLPSESEWEYAARAGSDTEYPWGNDVGSNNANCGECGSPWDGKQTAPVGSFKANKFGLYDMHGNVKEWVEDCWSSSYSSFREKRSGTMWWENKKSSSRNDGSAQLAGNCELRVVRGGTWQHGKNSIRSAYRNVILRSSGVYTTGFRVVRDLGERPHSP